MKKLTKVLSLVLALALVLMSVNIVAVNAADTYTITINNAKNGHKYIAYQVFKGTVDSTRNVLSDIDWGKGINHTTLASNLTNYIADDVTEHEGFAGWKTALGTALSGITSDSSAAEWAQKLDITEVDSAFSDESRTTRFLGLLFKTAIDKAQASGNATASSDGDTITIDDLEPGYYIIVDDDASGSAPYSDIIISLVGNASISPKEQNATVEKKTSDSASKGGYTVGDLVPFTITVHLPSNVSHYEGGYKLKLEDTFTGFDITGATTGTDGKLHGTEGTAKKAIEDSLEVKDSTAGNTDVKAHFEAYWDSSDHFIIEHVTTGVNDGSKKEHWTDHDGHTLVFTYSAKLAAAAASSSNKGSGENNVTLTYSNDPTVSGSTAELTDKTEAYTFKLNVKKEDGESHAALEGAEFTLTKVGDTSNTFSDKKTSVADTGLAAFNGLGVGSFKLEETKAPDGYNTAEEVYIVIEAVKSDLNESLTTLNAKEYTKAQWDTASNKPKDPLSGSPIELTTDEDAGTIAITISDNKGATLPETGGMGTKIFYTLGGVLVVGAVVLLVVKRRMRAE